MPSLGEAECLELLAPIEAKYPAEAAAIRATYYWNQKDTAQAAAALERVLRVAVARSLGDHGERASSARA